MTTAQILLAEVLQEAKATRKLLSLVPFEKADFKPHEKSMSLIRLAAHVAEISGWWKECLVQDELDFSKGNFASNSYNSTEDILKLHDTLVAKAEVILANAKEEDFLKSWTMRNGDQIYFTQPKSQVVRTWCMNHLYHHRGQLNVYLRLLDISLPEVYGPSADNG